MIRDITIGQYYAADSIIHKLDPRVKLAGTMLYIISLFTADGPICYLLAVFALAAVIHLSTVPFKFMARGLKSIVIILLITVSFNLFLTPGTSIIDVWLLRHITWEGSEASSFFTTFYNLNWGKNERIHGNTFDSFDSWLINHDTYDNAKCADRWPREEPWFLKKGQDSSA